MSLSQIFNQLVGKLETLEDDFNTRIYDLDTIDEIEQENIDDVADILNTLITTCYKYAKYK